VPAGMSYSFVLNSNPQPRQRRLTVARPFNALSLPEFLREVGDHVFSLRSRRQSKAWRGARQRATELLREVGVYDFSLRSRRQSKAWGGARQRATELLREVGVYDFSLRSRRQSKAWGGARQRGTPGIWGNQSHRARETGGSCLLSVPSSSSS